MGKRETIFALRSQPAKLDDCRGGRSLLVNLRMMVTVVRMLRHSVARRFSSVSSRFRTA